MSNFKSKKTGLYQRIKNESEIDICGGNLILFSIDIDLKNINYVISKDNFKKYIKLLEVLFVKDEIIELKTARELLEKDIYITYKTKVSQKRIPQILLNVLVMEDFLYTDNGVDFEFKGKNKDLNKIINKYCI